MDRRTGSYPRIAALDNPARTLLSSTGDKHRFSQRLVDLIDLRSGTLESRSAEAVMSALPAYQQRLLYSHDTDAEREFREQGLREEILFLSCSGIVQNKALMNDMSDILSLLQEQYDHPVDIEYTVNFSPSGGYLIDLLQCRPLTRTPAGETVRMPEAGSGEIPLLETKGVSMGFSRSFAVDAVVYVDAVAYYRMPNKEKYSIKEAISAINWYYREKNRKLVLITPGRIGTSSPELGVPTSFADISEFNTVIEVSESKAGYMPELSYGSHFFQDLVEAGILYSAVFKDDTTLTFDLSGILAMENRLKKYFPSDNLSHVLHVAVPEDRGIRLYFDMVSERLLITQAPGEEQDHA